jgi:phosphatidylglycerophosphate synthase
MVMWRKALIIPDQGQDWQWGGQMLLGLPAALRLVLTLSRAGVREVIFPDEAGCLRPVLESWKDRRTLPRIVWGAGEVLEETSSAYPILGVRGGVIFEKSLLPRFEETVDYTLSQVECHRPGDDLPVLISFNSPAETRKALTGWPESGSSVEGQAALTIPGDLFCRSVGELRAPGADQDLLTAAGKPTDRWHVRWVRRWTFPAIRFLAGSGITPNQISWTGFLVGAAGCLLIARGGYWSGVAGALILYASWVLDCMDGTLARLTFSESPYGEKLDTMLGHIANLLVFSALIWAVYGKESPLKAGLFAFFILGGIILAREVSKLGKKIRAIGERPAGGFIQSFLDKLNHRDYAVVVLLLALVNGFKIFLWMSLVGVQLFWITQLWLLIRKGKAVS